MITRETSPRQLPELPGCRLARPGEVALGCREVTPSEHLFQADDVQATGREMLCRTRSQAVWVDPFRIKTVRDLRGLRDAAVDRCSRAWELVELLEEVLDDERRPRVGVVGDVAGRRRGLRPPHLVETAFERARLLVGHASDHLVELGSVSVRVPFGEGVVGLEVPLVGDVPHLLGHLPAVAALPTAPALVARFVRGDLDHLVTPVDPLLAHVGDFPSPQPQPAGDEDDEPGLQRVVIVHLVGCRNQALELAIIQGVFTSMMHHSHHLNAGRCSREAILNRPPSKDGFASFHELGEAAAPAPTGAVSNEDTLASDSCADASALPRQRDTKNLGAPSQSGQTVASHC